MRKNSEQAVLDGVSLRLIEPREQERFDRLIEAEYCLRRAEWVGERVFYVAEYQGQWLALRAWASAADHLKHRDAWIGWNDKQRARRLKLVRTRKPGSILPRKKPCSFDP